MWWIISMWFAHLFECVQLLPHRRWLIWSCSRCLVVHFLSFSLTVNWNSHFQVCVLIRTESIKAHYLLIIKVVQLSLMYFYTALCFHKSKYIMIGIYICFCSLCNVHVCGMFQSKGNVISVCIRSAQCLYQNSEMYIYTVIKKLDPCYIFKQFLSRDVICTSRAYAMI